MSLRVRTLPAGFIEPCLPTSSSAHLPVTAGCSKQDKRVRLYSRPGNDLTSRFPLIAETVVRLRARTCIIDGEAVACGADGIACFDLKGEWPESDDWEPTPSTQQ
jgi:hypothetical protein